MNKKANVMDALPIIAILLGIVLFGTIISIIVSAVNTEFQADASIGTEAKGIIQTGATEFPKIMDIWFMLFLIGLPLISAIFAYFNNIHPLFFWLSLPLVVLIVLIGGAINVLYDELAADSLLGAAMSASPMTSYVMGNFGIYAFFVVLIITSGTFVKLRANRSGGFYP